MLVPLLYVRVRHPANPEHFQLVVEPDPLDPLLDRRLMPGEGRPVGRWVRLLRRVRRP